MSLAYLQDLIDAWRDGSLNAEQAIELNAMLRESESARELFRRESEMHGLLHAAVTASMVEASAEHRAPLVSVSVKHTPRWYAWRPLTAAAAGIVIGMFCTSMVFGLVAQRTAVKKIPLLVFDAGLENAAQTLKDGLPDRVGQWGMDEASVVAAEGRVLPLQGERMMRLEPIPQEKPVKNHTSRAYQMLDLRSQPVAVMIGEVEAEVTASFCAMNSALSSRYLIRAIALDEASETATKNFWSKVESDGVVSESQRFDTLPGDSGWHTFSMKPRLPPGSKTLVLVFGAVPLEDAARLPSVHYLDGVQVTLLNPQPLP